MCLDLDLQGMTCELTCEPLWASMHVQRLAIFHRSFSNIVYKMSWHSFCLLALQREKGKLFKQLYSYTLSKKRLFNTLDIVESKDSLSRPESN